jgi:hypothetical protein
VGQRRVICVVIDDKTLHQLLAMSTNERHIWIKFFKQENEVV